MKFVYLVDDLEDMLKLTLADKAKIIELCCTKGLCLTLVAKYMKCSVQTVSRVVSEYIPEQPDSSIKMVMTLESKV